MSLQTYRRATPEPAWPARALLVAETTRIFLVDILPILARHWTRQQLRNLDHWLSVRGF
ncbi:hypothetical protein GCM10009630_11370 [Kribbella jejuensis]|uniref:Uncharacterized protein n=1 Tax=Kribbella jejuensis TaxID=236068 RepID=A0A542E9W7_9ACTN|nr:hypothetical protein [Kribbella jejuensis]TQJ12121.1 hypothetical protein FB475_5049 [Kribbella jejuensis]